MTHEKVMELILDHYNHPRNYGEIEDAPIVCSAGASIVLEIARGMTVPEIEAMSAELLGETLGKRVALTRHGCVHLGFNTLKAAIENWRRKLLEQAARAE